MITPDVLELLDSGQHDLFTHSIAAQYARFLHPWSDEEARAVAVLDGGSDPSAIERLRDTLNGPTAGMTTQERARRAIFRQATHANGKVDWTFTDGITAAAHQAGLSITDVEAPFVGVIAQLERP